MPKKILIIVIILVILILVAGVGGYFWGGKIGYQAGYMEGVKVGKAASKASPGEVVSNPLEGMPDTNPFGKFENPFAGYNPFK